MSAWGVEWFQDDYTCDVRDFYMNELYNGSSHSAALEAASKKFTPQEDDEHLFWGTIAKLQWERGYLSPKVQERALQLLRTDRDSKYWESASEQEQRHRVKVRNKLIAKLESPQGRPRRTMRPRGTKCPFKPGDLVTMRMFNLDWKNFGRPGNDVSAFFQASKIDDVSCFQDMYCLLYIAAIKKDPTNVEGVFDEVPIYGVYHWVGRQKPTEEIAQKYPLIELPIQEGETGIWFRTANVVDKSARIKCGVELIGHTDIPPVQMKYFPQGWVQKTQGWGEPTYILAHQLYSLGQRGPTEEMCPKIP